MKVYRLDDFTSLDDLQLREEDDPRPQRCEVVVRVHAVSLNFRDIAMLRGRYPLPHRKGLIPTSDGAGEVMEVGAEVDDFKVGDRVMWIFHRRWFGGQMPPEGQTLLLLQRNRRLAGRAKGGQPRIARPDSRLLLVRGGVHVAVRGADGLERAHSRQSDSLRAHCFHPRNGRRVHFRTPACEGVWGHRHLHHFQSAKADRLRSLGADAVVNYKEEQRWGQRVRELTGGQGVDRVVEVGGPGKLGESLCAIRPGGEIASIRFLSAEATGVDYFALFESGATFRHISVGSREGLQNVARTIVGSGVTPVIDRVFGFENARDTFAHLESGLHFGKVVIRCSSIR